MQAQKYEIEVGEDGAVALPPLNLAHGIPMEVIVIVHEQNNSSDGTGQSLLSASESSTAFWDNTVDEEVWNDAWPARDYSHSTAIH